MGATNSVEVMGAANSAEVMVERAKQIITRHFSEDIYHITFDRRGGKSPKTEIGIFNKDLLPPSNKEYDPFDFYCIECDIFDNKPSILHIGLLSRCGLRGTTHLEKIIDFAKDCGFSEITLEDASSIVYTINDDPTDTRRVINLAQLTRLMKGQSWYEQFGFTNDKIDSRKKDIQDDIKQPIRIYPQELIDRIQETISLTIDLEIEPTISISEAASYLYKCLTTMCPERKCRSNDDLDVAADINSIVKKMYKEMLSRLTMEEDHFYDLHLILHQRKQKGSSRMTRRTRRQQNKKAGIASHKRKRTRRCI